jgi:hypothetical protein
MNDQTLREHCGPDAFSPPAPQAMCEQLDHPPVHHVPEPGTIILLIVAFIMFVLVRRK